MKIEKRDLNIIELVVLAVISLFALIITAVYAGSVVIGIGSFLVTSLLLGAVWLLFLKNHRLASYLILGFGWAFFGIQGLLQTALSFNFSYKQFFSGFDWVDLVKTFISVYIGFFIYLYFKEEGFKFNKENFVLSPLNIVFTAFVFFDYGITSMIYILAIQFIALNYMKESSLVLMVSKALIPIYLLINLLTMQDGYKLLTINSINVIGLAIAIIVLAIITTVKLFSKTDKTEPEEIELNEEVWYN